MTIKISTLNLCLGLKNKKLLVKKLPEVNDIDVLCMQETEVMKDINHNELKISEYLLELELNTKKSRVGVYISKTINYVRRTDLEGIDSNLIIIELEVKCFVFIHFLLSVYYYLMTTPFITLNLKCTSCAEI